jgi:hypothetical protein
MRIDILNLRSLLLKHEIGKNTTNDAQEIKELG